MDPDFASGTIVLCDGLGDGEPVAAIGAAGAILYEDQLRDVALSYPLPASYLGLVDGAEVYAYINTTRSPTATIFRSDQLNETLAPYVVSFSSRGPNPITMDILKVAYIYILLQLSQVIPLFALGPNLLLKCFLA